MPEAKIFDLSRPVEGQRNVIRMPTGIRFAKLISKKFICPKCWTFCGEMVPILDSTVRRWMAKNKKTLAASEIQVKVFCFAGCHDHPSWGWKNFDWDSVKEKNSIREWPVEWSDRGIQDTERRAREANDAYKGGAR